MTKKWLKKTATGHGLQIPRLKYSEVCKKIGI